MIKKPSQIKFFIPTSLQEFDATAEPTLETLTGEDYFGNVIAAGGQAINAMDMHPRRPFQADTDASASAWRIDTTLEREIRTKFWMIDGHNLRDIYPLGLKQTIDIYHDINAVFSGATEITPNRNLSGLLGKPRPYVRLNGVSHQISIPTGGPTDITTGDFALQFYGRPYKLTGTQTLSDKDDGIKGYGLRLVDDDLYIKLDDGSVSTSIKIADAICSVNDDIAIHVDFDRSGNATAYIMINNGELTQIGQVGISSSGLTLSAAEDTLIGQDTTSGNTPFNGRVYFWRLWSRISASTTEIEDSFKGELPSSGINLELTHDGLDPSGGKWNANYGDFEVCTVTGIFMETPTGDDRGFYLAEYDEVDARYYFTNFNSLAATGRSSIDALVGQVVMGQMYEFNGVKVDNGLSGNIDYPGILTQQSLGGIVQTEKAYGKQPSWSVDFQISTIQDFEDMQIMMDIIEGSLIPFYVIFNYDDLDPVVWRVRASGGLKWGYTYGPSQPMSPSLELVMDI